MLCPSFLYTTHLEHHTQSIYGTAADGEYVSWGARHPAHIVRSLLLGLGVPLLLVFRFAALGPLSWIVPGMRAWIEQRASALVVHETHRRAKPNPKEIRAWRWQEGAASFWVLAILLAGAFGLVSWRWFLTFLAVTAAISFLNAVRTVLSHRFRNTAGKLTMEDQVGDSVNHATGGLLVELLCPVGLRFHALHHMLPSLPYHSLSEAHQILMTTLPSDSVYRRTNSPGLWATMRTLWMDAAANHRRDRGPRKGARRGAV
jgi:fatty acid desaturase